MAISLVQKAIHDNAGATTNSVTVTPTSATTAGNLLVAYVFSDNGPETITAPANWTLVVNVSAGTDHCGALFYYKNNPGSLASFTFTRASNIQWAFAVAFAEYSGVDTTAPLDTSNSAGNGGSAGPVNPGSITTTNANDLLVFGATEGSGTLGTVSTGWTAEENDATYSSTGFGLADRIVSSTGAYAPTWTLGTTSAWSGVQAAFKAAAAGGSVNGSATATGSGSTGGGLAGQGSINAQSAATPSETFQGSGALGTGQAGAGGLASGLSGSGSLGQGLSGSGAVGGGLAGAGAIQAASAALNSALFTGMGALFTGISGQGIIPAVAGSLGGAVHGAATLLGMGAALFGIGGHGDIQAQSAATPTQTLKGSGALGNGLSGSGAVSPQSAATPGIAFQGAGAIGTGQSGSGSLSGRGAATPGITFHGMGTLLAGLFSGSGTLPPPAGSIGGLIVGVFRWLYTSAYNVLQQAFAPRQVQTMVFGGTAYLTMTFVREPTDMVTPNSTIQVIMTAKKYDGTLMSNLSVVTCTVTFPDGSTSAFALNSGIVNTGSGTYTLTYVTKMAGENIEDWVGTDASGNTAEYHNITPVSF